MADRSLFEDFARKWLLANQEQYADCVIDLMLKGPMARVPVQFRVVAKALRTIRDGGRVKLRTRTRGRR